jgi:hypothetical protein
MQKFGIAVDQLSPHGQAAVSAAERLRARTVIYRNKVPVAAIVPAQELDKLDPPDPAEDNPDPLLTLCGSSAEDAFVDAILQNLGRTLLFRRLGEDTGPTRERRKR